MRRNPKISARRAARITLSGVAVLVALALCALGGTQNAVAGPGTSDRRDATPSSATPIVHVGARRTGRSTGAATLFATAVSGTPNAALWLGVRLAADGAVMPLGPAGRPAFRVRQLDLDGTAPAEQLMIASRGPRALLAVVTGSAGRYRAAGTALFRSVQPLEVDVRRLPGERGFTLQVVSVPADGLEFPLAGQVGPPALPTYRRRRRLMWYRWRATQVRGSKQPRPSTVAGGHAPRAGTLVPRFELTLADEVRGPDRHFRRRSTVRVESGRPGESAGAFLRVVTTEALTSATAPYAEFAASRVTTTSIYAPMGDRFVQRRRQVNVPGAAAWLSVVRRLDATGRTTEAAACARTLLARYGPGSPTSAGAAPALDATIAACVALAESRLRAGRLAQALDR